MSSFKVFCTKCKMSDPILKVYPGTKVVRAFCQTATCKNEDNLTHSEPATAFVMPFGKYKGETIAEIVAADERYAIWAAENLENDRIRQLFEKELSNGQPG